jgi:hypothetical protein
VFRRHNRGYLYGPKVDHVAKVELKAVLQRGRPATMCGRPTGSWGRTDLVATNPFLLSYGEIFPRRT